MVRNSWLHSSGTKELALQVANLAVQAVVASYCWEKVLMA
jgi:hypothetical protein